MLGMLPLKGSIPCEHRHMHGVEKHYKKNYEKNTDCNKGEEHLMPDSQLDRDLKVLTRLARRAAEDVEIALTGMPASIRAGVRGPLSAAVLTALVEGYRQDRERYARATPPSPPTPVPPPSL
jgi:hypothetical protein